MIGRIDSTPDRWRTRLASPTAFLAIAALLAVGGSTTALAQNPPARTKGTAVPRGNPAPTSDKSDQDQPPADIPPPPGSMALPGVPDDNRPRLDKNVIPAEADDKGPLPEAKTPPAVCRERSEARQARALTRSRCLPIE